MDMNTDSRCAVCEIVIREYYEKPAHMCKTCRGEFCDKCFKNHCDIGGGQDQDLYFSCPKCLAEIFTDRDLLEYFLAKNKTTRNEVAFEYRKWRLNQGYCSEIVAEYNHETHSYDKYINLSFDTELPDDVLVAGFYNKNNCGGACDWSITSKPFDDAMFSTKYNGELYLYVFSYYDADVESCDMHSFMKWVFPNAISIGDGSTEYIVLCNEVSVEMRKLYDHNGESFIDICPDAFGGVIYFSRLW